MQTDSRMKLLYLTSPSGYFLGEHVWYICGDFCRPLVRNTSPGVSADNVSCIVWIMWPTGFMWVRGLELPVPSTQDVYSKHGQYVHFQQALTAHSSSICFPLVSGNGIEWGLCSNECISFCEHYRLYLPSNMCICYRLPELSTASGNDPWKIIMKAFEGMVVLLAFHLIPL